MSLWTVEHAKTLLPALAGMILLAVVLRKLLGNREWEIRMIPIQVLAVALLLLEEGKQIVSLWHGYDLYHLPFHFCSLFIFCIPAAAFYRGKYSRTVMGVATAWSAALFLLMMIYPALIYSDGNINEYFRDYMSFHTVTFHNVVMLIFVLILALDLYTPQKKTQIKASMAGTGVFCVISATMAQLLKTNYANYYSCNIPPLEEVRLSLQGVLGVGVTQLLYVLIVSALNFLFVLLSIGFYNLLRRLLFKK